MNTLKFEIIETIAHLREKKGWAIELNYMKWGDKEARYDIRGWRVDHQMVGKGLGLNEEEMDELVENYLKFKKEKQNAK